MRNAETNTGKAKQAITCSSPSAEAVALAVMLSGHTHCQRLANIHDEWGGTVCDGCLGDAATIDATLQLPARNAALLLAQNLVDAYDRSTDIVDPVFVDELREALSRIGKP